MFFHPMFRKKRRAQKEEQIKKRDHAQLEKSLPCIFCIRKALRPDPRERGKQIFRLEPDKKHINQTQNPQRRIECRIRKHSCFLSGRPYLFTVDPVRITAPDTAVNQSKQIRRYGKRKQDPYQSRQEMFRQINPQTAERRLKSGIRAGQKRQNDHQQGNGQYQSASDAGRIPHPSGAPACSCFLFRNRSLYFFCAGTISLSSQQDPQLAAKIGKRYEDARIPQIKKYPAPSSRSLPDAVNVQ